MNFIHAQNGVDTNGKKHGAWQVTVQGAVVFEGNYNHGLKEGEFKTYNHDSHKLENWNNFSNDKFHGLQKKYEGGILLWEANYTNGIKVGIETQYHANGNKKAELTYSSTGELEGNISVYDENGNRLAQEITSGTSQRTISTN